MTSPGYVPGRGGSAAAAGAPTATTPRIRIDAYGADPTGVASSDAAWTAAYAAAVAKLRVLAGNGNPGSGVLIEYGPGVYQHSLNTVVVSDKRIGIVGAGQGATTIYSLGNTGDLMFLTDTSAGSHSGFTTSPVGGFTLFGWQTGAATNGLHCGDRDLSRITEVAIQGFQGAGSRGAWFRNDNNWAAGLEGSVIQLDVQKCTTLVEFDGGTTATPTGANGTFDYCEINLHLVQSSSARATTGVLVSNQGHLYGGRLHVSGNVSAGNASFTATALQVGTSGTDTARIRKGEVVFSMECDASVGTVYDIVVNTASGTYGIDGCFGAFSFYNTAGSFTAGSITGGVISAAGTLLGPVFGLAGQRVNLGANYGTFDSTLSTQVVNLPTDLNTKATLAATPQRFLTNPGGLRRLRAKRGNALFGRTDIVVVGNSIAAGQGGTGLNSAQPSGTATWAASDNRLGWVGQMRTALNAPLGLDPGEGFIFATDVRCTRGGVAATYNYAGPLRQSVNLGTTGTLTFTTPTLVTGGAGVGTKCAYVGVIWWDNSANSLPTVTVGGSAASMFTTPGGGTASTASGSNSFKVGYVAAGQAAAVVVTGNATGGTYCAGLDLVGDTTGYHVHRMGQYGFVTSDLVGGSTSGTLNGTSGAGNQQDRVIRAAYQWISTPGLLIVGHMDVNDWTFQTVTRTVTVQFTSTTAFTVTSGAIDWTDNAKSVSGTNIGGGALMGSPVDATHGVITGATYTGTLGASVTMTVTSPVSQSGITPALSAQYLSQFLNNTGGTASTGALALGWSALVITGPRNTNDSLTPAPANLQSAYTTAQQGVINTTDANYKHVTGLNLAAIWGSYSEASGTDMSLYVTTATVHPSLAGHGDIAQTVGWELIRNAASVGALTATIPA